MLLGQQGKEEAYLRFIKPGCPVLASLLCRVVISSQLLASSAGTDMGQCHVQSPERRNFCEILHLISQSWPEYQRLGGLAKLNAYSVYSSNWGDVKMGLQHMSVLPSTPGTANSQCRKQ